METLLENFRQKIAATDTRFVRGIEGRIHWNARLICIRGARGTGKTTLLLQHIKTAFAGRLEKALYVSLDNLFFADNSLIDLAENFIRHGGTHLFLDEVHKYPDWSQAVKNLYDDHPELSVVFTGSSLLEILNARGDLSRRALVYDMQGLSFREYLAIKTGREFSAVPLEEVVRNNEALSSEIAAEIRPFQYFQNYLETGYYPFFTEGEEDYGSRLNETVNMILEIELPLLRKVEISYIPKIRKLLAVIGKSAPFIPNVTELAAQIGISRQTLLAYFQYLEDAKVVTRLFRESRGLGALEKPDKLFLENTNLMSVLSGALSNVGNVRETFVLNQLRNSHEVLFSKESDFLVDKKYTFEVGGKNKTGRQLKDLPDSYIVADNIEYGTGRRIPIWLLGFLY